MGVRLIVGDGREGSDNVAMYDSVSGWAFGPVFADEDNANAFIDWLPQDARRYSNNELAQKHSEWLRSREES